MFEQMLQEKQTDMEMNNTTFAEYLNMSRSWVVGMYSDKVKKRPLRRETMSKLYNRLGIPFEVMEEYNDRLEDM